MWTTWSKAIVRVMRRPAAPNSGPDAGPAPYKVYNTGSSESVPLMDFIRLIEAQTGRKAIINCLPLQPGDVPDTFADAEDLIRDTGFRPCTPVEEGVARFVEWYCAYYGK